MRLELRPRPESKDGRESDQKKVAFEEPGVEADIQGSGGTGLCRAVALSLATIPHEFGFGPRKGRKRRKAAV